MSEELEQSKKAQILEAWESGTHDIAEIVKNVAARPSYVAQVLQQAGHLDGFFDLYTTTHREQNVYTRYFKNVLNFKDVDCARESCARLTRLYDYFERLGDRAGQHQATVIALTGASRARWSGKLEEAAIFGAWILSHVTTEPADPTAVTLAEVVRQYRSEHNSCNAGEETGCPCETCEAAKAALLAAGEPLEDLS